MTSFSVNRWLVSTLLIVLALLAVVAGPALAEPGLSVSNALILTDVKPGQTLTQKMTVALAGTDPAIDITVKVSGVAQSLQGNYILLDAVQDPGRYSARTFVSVDRTSFHLEPGGSQDIIASVQIPLDVGAGGRYAVINIATQPVSTTGVGIITAVNVPVFLTVQGSLISETGRITGLTTPDVAVGRPISILTDFQNTGNHHFKVQGQVAITDDRGQVVAEIPVPLTGSSIIPGMTRRLESSFSPDEPLAAGSYTLKVRVTLPDGTLLDEATGNFSVEAPSGLPSPAPSALPVEPAVADTAAPPTGELAALSSTQGTTQLVASSILGTAALRPSSASVLQNADGSIFINFPPGAVVAPVNVALEKYSIDQIAALPSGVTPASTCFQVTGLTGLLAADATVNVRYSREDLEQAGDQASRLRLARWDAETNRWTVLKTSVDTGAGTLSARSNRMGLWAVVAGSSPVIGRLIPVISALAVILIVILGVLYLKRRRQPAVIKPKAVED